MDLKVLWSGIQFGNSWIELNADSESDLSKKHNSNIRSFCIYIFKLDATLLKWSLNKTVNYLNKELRFRTALPCRSPEACADTL